MNKIKIISFVFLFLVLPAFFTAVHAETGNLPEEKIAEARKLITGKRAECVVIAADGKILTERGRGVSPLLTMYKREKDKLKGGILVDKVIGRAAAFIAIKAEVKFVHGELMSEDAVALLNEHGIKNSNTMLVHRILNRKRNGLCPLEASVLKENDPDKAVKILDKKTAELSGGKKAAR